MFGRAAFGTSRAAMGAIVVALAAVGGVWPSFAGGDAREKIQLSFREREQIRAGMRAYLESVQGIVEGLAQHKMAVVARNADKSGERMVADVPVALALRLPPQFVLMSVDTHRKFDELAKAARETRTKLAVTSKLNEVLMNCTSCHAMFRF